MYNLMDAVIAHVTEHGKISLEEFYALESKNDKRPTLKASRDLKLSIEDMQKCMKKLKSLPLIKDTKVDVSKLKEYQNEMRASMKDFIEEARNVYSFYYQDLKYDMPDITTESAIDDYNDKVKKVIEDTEDELKKISKNAKSKREKEEAFIKIANIRLETVQDAFKAVEVAYNDFMKAVKDIKPDIDHELEVLVTQCDIFIQQYQLLTGYVGSEIKSIIKHMTLSTLAVVGATAGSIFIKNPLLQMILIVPASLYAAGSIAYAVSDMKHKSSYPKGSYVKLNHGSSKTIKQNIEEFRASVKSKD